MTTQNPIFSDTAESAHAAVREVQAAVSRLLEQRATTEQRRADLVQRRNTLFEQPLGAACLRQFLGELIDYRAQAYANAMQAAAPLDQLAYPKARYGRTTRSPEAGGAVPPLTLEDAEQALGRKRADNAARLDPLDDDGWKLPVFRTEGEFMVWPYFFFGDLMKEKLGQLLADVEPRYVKLDEDAIGAPMDERRKEIETISQEVQRLDEELGRIHMEINSLTLPVIHGAKRLAGAAVGAA